MKRTPVLLYKLLLKLDRFINIRVECSNCSVPLFYEGQVRKFNEFTHYNVLNDATVLSIYIDERDYLCITVQAPHFIGARKWRN